MEIEIYNEEQSEQIRELIVKLETQGNKKCFLCKRYSGAKYRDPKRPDIKPKGITLRKIYYAKHNYNICTDCFKYPSHAKQEIFQELQTQARTIKTKLENEKKDQENQGKIIKKKKIKMKEIIIFTLCGISVIATVLIIAFYLF